MAQNEILGGDHGVSFLTPWWGHRSGSRRLIWGWGVRSTGKGSGQGLVFWWIL